MASPLPHSSALDARLASLEEEAARLREELAALQEEMRWLVGEDDEEPEPGWLARGWLRASLLLATVGVVALVSVPYLLHLDASPANPDQATAVTSRPARVTEPVRDAPAVIEAGAREHVLAPVRVRATAAPEPARIPVPGAAPVRDDGP